MLPGGGCGNVHLEKYSVLQMTLGTRPSIRVDCVCPCSPFEQRWRHDSLHLTCDSQQDLDGPLMKRWPVCAGPSNLGVLLTSFVTKNAAKLVLRDAWGLHRTGDVPSSALFPEELVLEPSGPMDGVPSNPPRDRLGWASGGRFLRPCPLSDCQEYRPSRKCPARRPSPQVLTHRNHPRSWSDCSV